MKPDLLKVLLFYGADVQEHRVSQLIRCPVHEEARASCSVNLQKQLWSCKACGAQGDSYTLIKLKEGLDHFGEVVDFAAERLGVSRGVAPGVRGRRQGGRRGFRPATKRRGLSG